MDAVLTYASIAAEAKVPNVAEALAIAAGELGAFPDAAEVVKKSVIAAAKAP
jgi:hypothetical protein